MARPRSASVIGRCPEAVCFNVSGLSSEPVAPGHDGCSRALVLIKTAASWSHLLNQVSKATVRPSVHHDHVSQTLVIRTRVSSEPPSYSRSAERRDGKMWVS